jgi:hypothetical protein
LPICLNQFNVKQEQLTNNFKRSLPQGYETLLGRWFEEGEELGT